MPKAGESGGIVILFPLSKGNFLEMLPIAKALKAQGRLRPLFCLDPRQSVHLPLAQADGIEAVRPDGSPLAASVPAKPVSDMASREDETSAPSAKQRTFSLLPSLLQALLSCRAERRKAKRLFQAHPDIRLVLLVGDRNVGYETAVIAEANRRRVASMIVPFAMSFPEASAEPRLRRGTFEEKYGVNTVFRKILRLFFPSWVRVHKGQAMFFHPPSIAFAAWILGMYPRRPWLIGGGAAKRMAVESEAMRDLLLIQGMEPQKMVVTGKPSLDDIARSFASSKTPEIRQKLGIAPDERVILCSVPQLAEHDILPWDRHRTEMEFLFETLVSSGARVVLSLHPKCDRAWYQSLSDKAGAQIADERIYDLLPLCDVLVATYSSTVAQAIALGKPAVVVDFYDLGYPLYVNAPGVTVLWDRDALLPLLKRLLQDPEAYEKQVRAQREHGAKWALLDGKNTERVLDIALELVNQKIV